jgi:hypothetical protein
VESVYTDIWVAHHLCQWFDFSHRHQVAQVALQAEAALVVLDVQSCPCGSSVTADSVLGHLSKDSSRLFDFHESVPGLLLSPPSPVYAQETQLFTSSLLGLWHEVSWFVGAFLLSRHMKILLWPFWPHSRRMSDCSSCTTPPCLAIVAFMLKTYKALGKASKSEICQ